MLSIWRFIKTLRTLALSPSVAISLLSMCWRSLIFTSKHLQHVTVCGLTALRVRFSFKKGEELTLTSIPIVTMPCSEIICYQNVEKNDWWLQPVGVTCHTANVTNDLLRAVLEYCITSRNEDVNWTHGSCKSTPLYLFLWRAVKLKWSTKHP